MSFSADERNALLALKGVGATVISRLEEMGYDSLAQLSSANTQHIVSQAAAITGSVCWKNSPQARAAIDAVIALAKKQA
jgi:hypothetical protein